MFNRIKIKFYRKLIKILWKTNKFTFKIIFDALFDELDNL